MIVNFRPRPRAPDELGGVKIPYPKAARRTGRKIGWYLILLVVLSPILYLAAGMLGSWLNLEANGRVALSQREIRATASGIVERLEVRPGEAVAAGEALARIDNLGIEAMAARNAIDRRASRAARRRLAAQRRAWSSELRARRRALRYLRHRRAILAQLVERGAATAAELDAATVAVSDAEAADARVQAALAADALSTDTAAVDHEWIARRLARLTRRSPFAGRVLKVLVSPGEYVTAGEPLLVVARLAHPRIVAYVAPRDASRLTVGTVATVRFPDGTRMRALVGASPQISEPMPSTLVDPFGLRPVTVVLDLLPSARWPRNGLIENLPVSVRFHYRWESSAPGRFIGRILGAL